MLYQPLLEYSTPYLMKKTERFTSFPIHIHHEIEIIYCLEGSLSVKLDGIESRMTNPYYKNYEVSNEGFR